MMSACSWCEWHTPQLLGTRLIYKPKSGLSNQAKLRVWGLGLGVNMPSKRPLFLGNSMPS